MLSNIDLRDWGFPGPIPSSIKDLTQLVYLDLSVNQFVGSVPTFAFLKNLTVINLYSNRLTGRIPDSLWEGLEKLSFLDLRRIHWKGNFHHLCKRNSSYSFIVSRLGTLILASCKLQKFPFLRNLSSLMTLDLSDNQLHGEIPNWIWEVGDGFLCFLNLSHNQFSHLQEPYEFRDHHYLDQHSNMLRGEIPVPPRTAVFVDMSSNKFSFPLSANIGYSLTSAVFFSLAKNKIVGTIPPSLCNATRLQILDLSNNRLHGRIPSCLFEITIGVLNLRRNNLIGDVPYTFPVGCAAWGIVLPGRIIVNIASNEFNGVLPENLFKDLKALTADHDGPDYLKFLYITVEHIYYQDSVTLTLKRLNVQLGKILNIFTSVNYSNNHFQGIIPETIGELKSHHVLNFSHNALSGHIPGSIGNLEELASLDLSFNNLRGEIPEQLATLAFLSFLNLSYNTLVRRIL
ncbi:UNVERIFIED_CONTAM: Receptor-like protein 18 [Sesamum indicum]